MTEEVWFGFGSELPRCGRPLKVERPTSLPCKDASATSILSMHGFMLIIAFPPPPPPPSSQYTYTHKHIRMQDSPKLNASRRKFMSSGSNYLHARSTRPIDVSSVLESPNSFIQQTACGAANGRGLLSVNSGEHLQ